MIRLSFDALHVKTARISWGLLATQQRNSNRVPGLSAIIFALFIMMNVVARATVVSPTTTTLAISSTSVPYKTPIALTATVTTAGSPVTSGLVLFCDATAPVCENNSALGMAQLTYPNATATLRLGSGPLGVHSYKAVYRANKVYGASASNTVSYTCLLYT